jgi:uncharacterized RDD family membrane protein YckC
MLNQQLFEYIKKQLGNNFSKEQIKSSLIVNGWLENDIEACFLAVANQAQAIPITSTTPITSVEQISNINTITLPYSGFWPRVAASLVDGFILNLVFTILGFAYSLIPGSSSLFSSNGASLNQILLSLSYLFASLSYFSFMESNGGATFGKIVLGIKVLGSNGEPVGFLKSLARNFSKIISTLILMIGFIMAGFTKKKQGLHDIISNCIVVNVKEISAGKVWLVIILAILGTALVAASQAIYTLYSLFG